MNSSEKKVAALVLTLAAACFAWMLHAMGQKQDVARVMTLRSAPINGREHLALFLDKEFHLLDGQGVRVARQTLAELGLTEEPNDMDWVTTPEGGAQAWFYENGQPRVVRCHADSASSRLGRCEQVMAGPQLKTSSGSRSVHLAVDLSGQRVFFSDAGGQQVRVLGFDGTVLAVSPAGLLFYPNRLRLTPDKQLVVADNDNRRLVWLNVSNRVPDFNIQRTLRSADHPDAASRGASATKVTDVAFVPSDGPGKPEALWMLAVAPGQKNGRVLLFGEGLKPQGTANLGQGGDPLVIDAVGRSAVVADFNGIDLYRIGSAGEFLGPWGDAEFRKALGVQRDRFVWAKRQEGFAKGGFAVVVMVGFALAFWSQRKNRL